MIDVSATPSIRRAVILSAGKGSRLLPLTEHRPKCLLDFAGKTLLGRQLDALEESGISEIKIVTGFAEHLVDQEIAAREPGSANIQTIFNPFYQVADNLGSVWIARDEFTDNLLLLNGDTLVSPALIRKVLNNAEHDITVTIDRKETYDDDDMKVEERDGRLIHIGKKLSPQQSNAESIGLIAFKNKAPRVFIDTVEQMMRTAEGTSIWYLRVIEKLAKSHPIATTSIEGLEWAEVDFPEDYTHAQALMAEWDKANDGAVRANAHD
jgi:choline kinase